MRYLFSIETCHQPPLSTTYRDSEKPEVSLQGYFYFDELSLDCFDSLFVLICQTLEAGIKAQSLPPLSSILLDFCSSLDSILYIY